MNQISLESVVVRSSDQVSCDLSGEAAILGLRRGIYYGLDAVASEVWNLIEAPCAVGAICAVLLDEYDVQHDRCEREVIALLTRLAGEGLVELRELTSPSVQADSAP